MQKPSHKVRFAFLVRCGFTSLLFVLSFSLFSSAHVSANPASNVLCRAQLDTSLRQKLTNQLKEITGWSNLHFDEHGGLRYSGPAVGGSETARELITAAVNGKNVIVIEDASGRADVVFCRVVPGAWKKQKPNSPPAFVVLIDFADFSHVTGDSIAQAAFNPGWAALHEIAHVVHDANDAEASDLLGDCERMVNRMRRECGLAEREEYCYKLYPNMQSSAFQSRLVRLAFVQHEAAENKKRRYWLMWDANIVGGLPPAQNISAVGR